MAHKKRLATAQASVDPAKSYALDEAVGVVKGNATAKFDETVEMVMNLGIDPRHADQMVRGLVTLPERHRQDGASRRVRPWRQGRGGAGGRRRRGGSRGSGREGAGPATSRSIAASLPRT